MIKQTITQYFQRPQTNRLKNVPRFKFTNSRDPFQYLYPQKIIYDDLRLKLIKKKQHDSQKIDLQSQKIDPKSQKIDIQSRQTEDYAEKFKRFVQNLQLRKSATSRIKLHTMQYTALSALMVFGFYSSHVSGYARTLFIFKQTLKTSLYSSLFFASNQLIYPIIYQYSIQNNNKPIFTYGDVLSSFTVFPIILLVERNLFMSIRKSLFVSGFGMVRDLQIESNRFYLMNPDHQTVVGYYEMLRLKHPFEDYNKRIITENTPAQIERINEMQQKLVKQALDKVGGQKIPSTYNHYINPQLYRRPTRQQQSIHEQKAAKITQRILQERGIKWFSLLSPQQSRQKKQRQILQQENKPKKNYFWNWD